jgi:polysaccharide biosynthesis transport protein
MARSQLSTGRNGRSDRLPALPGRLRGRALVDARHQLSAELRASGHEEGGDGADLFGYWRILLKRRWTVLGMFAIVLASVLTGTLMMTPIHRATTTLQIDRNTINVVDVAGMAPVENVGDRDFYQTQYELLQSRALAQRVASKLDLAGNREPGRILQVSLWRHFKGLLTGEEPFPSSSPADGTEGIQRREQALVEAFRLGLSIEPVRNSRLVKIHYDSPDPAFSARAANTLAETFITSNLDRRFDASSYAKEYLEDRLEELKQKLEESERRLVSFAQDEQIVGTGASNNLSDQTLSALNVALINAREERIRAESRWRQAESSPALLIYGGNSNGSNGTIIGVLQERRAKLMADYQDRLSVYKAGYPLMLQLRAQIDEVDQQIGAETARIRSGVRAEFLAAQQREGLLEEQLREVTVDALDLQKRSIQYNIHKREVDTNRQLYDGLLQRYKEVGIAGGVSTNNISVVDQAGNGSKYKPNLPRNLALGAVIGLMLGVLLALVIEYLDDTLKLPEDVEKLLGLALLGVVPKLKPPATPAQALRDPRSAFAESYRSVRTALQFSTDQGVPRCLLVTSPMPNEGKSTTAIVLAQNFASLGKRVLLIDCDLRNPSLHRQFAAGNSTGLTNLLAGTAKPDDIVIPTTISNLSLIPTGPLPPNPAELLTGSRMLSLLTVALSKYDQIVLDAPPIIGLADAPILAHIAHGTLLVIEAGETRISVARNTLKRLDFSRALVVGAVMTKYDARKAGNSYAYADGEYNYYTYAGSANPRLAHR